MKNKNTKSFWNKKIISEQNNLFNSPIYLDKNKVILKYLQNAEGKLLNIGVGYGYIEQMLNIKLPNLKLYGIDISDVSIKLAKVKSKGKFLKANALKIPFKDQKFDYVLALDIIEHFKLGELELFFDQLNKKIKKGGKFIVSVPLNESKKDRMANRHEVSFTDTKLIGILTKNDFLIQRHKLLYAFERHYFIKSFFAKYLKFIKPNLFIVEAIKK